MPNYKDLFYPQLGIEAAYGCDAAPTLKLMGVESLELMPKRETEQVKVLDGRFAPSQVLVRTKHWGEATLSGLLAYEDCGLWLDSLFGAAADTNAAACTTDATGVQRIYKAPLATYNTDAAAVPTYTLIYGDTQATATDAQVHSLISAVAQSATISGESGAAARVEVSFIGHDVEADALDTSKVDRTVSYVMGDHWVLSIDQTTDALGTTIASDVAFKFSLEINTNRELLWHLGDLAPDSYRDAEWDGLLNLTIQAGPQVTTLLTGLLTSSPVKRNIRLKATSSSNSFQIDFCGALLEAPTLWTDEDGVTTAELAFQGWYNADASMSNWLKITTHNGVSAHSTMT
jgi:hypothetical protein